MKPIIARLLARQDVDDAVDHYAAQAGSDVAFRFLDALRDAYRIIAARPGTGSPRYGHELDLPGLRGRAIGNFPYLIFYVEQADHIDVWRVLHARRDIAKWLTMDE